MNNLFQQYSNIAVTRRLELFTYCDKVKIKSGKVFICTI